VTAPVEPDADLPSSDPGPRSAGRGSNGRPRNFLSGAEYRRLFWRLMPPAILILAALEWMGRPDRPAVGPASNPPIDTRIEAVAGPPPEPGTVVIEPSVPFVSEEQGPLAASAVNLGRVRDAAFFRRADHAAWQEVAATVRSQAASGQPRPTPAEVSFGELMGMPRSFRGRPVRIRGTLRRLEELAPPADAIGMERYWQGWLEPADGAAAPVVVHLFALPSGMPVGMAIHEPVTVEGYFLKTMAYRAADGVRVAPLILAAEPVHRTPPASQTAGSLWTLSLRFLAAGTMLGVVAALGLGFLAAGRGRRRSATPPDLGVTLAGFEPVPIAESLRRAAVVDETGSDGDSG
jgi:hypothetical protein